MGWMDGLDGIRVVVGIEHLTVLISMIYKSLDNINIIYTIMIYINIPNINIAYRLSPNSKVNFFCSYLLSTILSVMLFGAIEFSPLMSTIIYGIKQYKMYRTGEWQYYTLKLPRLGSGRVKSFEIR